MTRPSAVADMINAIEPSAVHIATEGPLGWLARHYCLRRGYPFTTAYHTRFPEYVKPRFGIPHSWSYRVLRHFHGQSAGIMVSTPSIEAELRARGFDTPIRRWTRGVDLTLFRIRHDVDLRLPRPISLFVGRLAVEKNVEAFLKLQLPGSKVVIGDGPMRAQLHSHYPNAHFVGPQFGEDLARYYAGSDVLVFSSRTDTFGLVILEALASGLPVAAYPVPGPQDVLDGFDVGVLDNDLGAAVKRALMIDRPRCRAWAERFSWDASADQFLSNLAVFRPTGQT